MMACDAQGRWAEGDAYVERIMENHDAEVRGGSTSAYFQILDRRFRQWTQPIAKKRKVIVSSASGRVYYDSDSDSDYQETT